MLATENWCIKVNERVYGPYTKDQMAAFATEGRLTLRSLVAPAGGNVYREARNYPPLSAMLNKTPAPARTFGKAQDTASPQMPAEGEQANFLVIFDVVAGTAGKAEPHLKALGPAFRMTDNVWVLQSTLTVLGIKNALTPHLSVREPCFIVDCSRGRTAWANFVPELQARLTRAWVRAKTIG